MLLLYSWLGFFFSLLCNCLSNLYALFILPNCLFILPNTMYVCLFSLLPTASIRLPIQKKPMNRLSSFSLGHSILYDPTPGVFCGGPSIWNNLPSSLRAKLLTGFPH